MEVKTVEDLKNLEITNYEQGYIYSKIFKSNRYEIRKESETKFAISDGEFYAGSLYYVPDENIWKFEGSFFEIDYDEVFDNLELALDFIIENARTNLIRIM
ncbi:hypothetical protein [Arcobacter vandammei]|uniref:hypothetical protein n=1 Tax=Arcobacter vandammei TaxID=2782243 RepID=UPI0018E0170A|nr:hypothetical protein [Arcobacter vandammei]